MIRRGRLSWSCAVGGLHPSTVRQNGFGLDEPFEARKESGIYPADVKVFPSRYTAPTHLRRSDTRCPFRGASFQPFASIGDKIKFESHVVLLRLLDVVDYLPDGHNVGRSSEPSDDGAPVVDDSFRLVDYALVFEFKRASFGVRRRTYSLTASMSAVDGLLVSLRCRFRPAVYCRRRQQV